MAIQNKKRKHEEEVSDHSDDQRFDDTTDANFESDLFEEMTTVNTKLISLAGKVKQIGIRYLMYNSSMIDEFIGNIHQFLQEFNDHRKKISSHNLNFDILTRVYQFLNTDTLINCGVVSKMWREVLHKCGSLQVKVTYSNLDKFLNGSLCKIVTSLDLVDGRNSERAYKSLAKNHQSLEKLEVLQLYEKNLSKVCVDYLTGCNFPRLTSLYLPNVIMKELDAKKLINSNFMANITQLDLSNSFVKEYDDSESSANDSERDEAKHPEGFIFHEFSNSFFKSISESKCMNQLTDLNISNGGLLKSKGIDVLLKDKPKLEHLDMEYHDLTMYPNLFMNGHFINLTTLDISYCEINNQDFVNLVATPNFPNLTTLLALRLKNFSRGQDEFPLNYQSSITSLDLRYIDLQKFPSILDYCPKIKQLHIANKSLLDYKKSKETLEQMMNSPCLKNLESLDIESGKEVLEIIFTNPIYSNLKELTLSGFEFGKVVLDSELIENSTNLVNLKALHYDGYYLSEECVLSFQRNPLLSQVLIQDLDNE